MSSLGNLKLASGVTNETNVVPYYIQQYRDKHDGEDSAEEFEKTDNYSSLLAPLTKEKVFDKSLFGFPHGYWNEINEENWETFEFSPEQVLQINLAIINNTSPANFANPIFSADIMEQLRLGYQAGYNMSYFIGEKIDANTILGARLAYHYKCMTDNLLYAIVDAIPVNQGKIPILIDMALNYPEEKYSFLYGNDIFTKEAECFRTCVQEGLPTEFFKTSNSERLRSKIRLLIDKTSYELTEDITQLEEVALKRIIVEIAKEHKGNMNVRMILSSEI